MTSVITATDAAATIAKALANKESPELAWYAGLNDDTRSLINALVAGLARQIPGVGALTGLEIIHAIHCYYLDGQDLRASRARARVERPAVNTHAHTKNAVGEGS